MSRTILANVDGFTPVIDSIVDELGPTSSLVFGRMWRYCQMENGVCQASLDTIGEGIGMDRSTVQRHAEKLCQAGYLVDLTPDLRNRPHTYADTGKAGLRVGIQTVAQSNVEPTTVAQSNVTVAESDMKKGVKKENTGAPNWDALLGTSVNQEITQRIQAMQAATDAFEKALLFGTLPWDSTGPWQRLAKFVTQLHAEDPGAFQRYADWRSGEGRFVAVSNAKIRQQPAMFIDTAWPEFVGRTQAASGAVDERPEYRPFVQPSTEGAIPAPGRRGKK